MSTAGRLEASNDQMDAWRR